MRIEASARLVLYDDDMPQPSEYESRAWSQLQEFRGRPASTMLQRAGHWAASGAAKARNAASSQVGRHPRAKAALDHGAAIAEGGGRAVAKAAHRVSENIPEWAVNAAGAVQRSTAKVARLGLSSKAVVKRYQRRGHDVSSLSDIRTLDLEVVDGVRGSLLDWYYPALAALSGVGASFVMTGSEVVVVAGAGAAAAPGAVVLASAFTVDAAAVLALSSRAVGQIALSYGFDPEEPSEKLFIMSVVNAGTALTASTKTLAFRDVSRLAADLVRNKSWTDLNRSVVAKVAQRFAALFEERLIKQSLGKMVPAAGMVIGGSLNWVTLEGIVDAAEFAYRKRFLLEKYPEIGGSDAPPFPEPSDHGSSDTDVDISLVKLLGDEIDGTAPSSTD